MKKGQTSVRGGIQDFLCPFTDMNITQGSNYGTHAGTMANDVASGIGGYKAPYYAPCDCKLVWSDPDNGQGMWQSLNKVRFANENIAYATFLTAHDNTFDAKIGQIVKQGQQLGNMGDKAGNGGRTTGVHCHIEIAQNKYTVANWKKNNQGIYCFPKEYDTDACYFMDGTNIINGMGGSWKYLKDVPVAEPVDENKVKIEALEKQVKELTATNSLQKDEIKNRNAVIDKLSKEIETLENRILEVVEERDTLKENQPKKIFECSRTDNYQILLYVGEGLYIK